MKSEKHDIITSKIFRFFLNIQFIYLWRDTKSVHVIFQVLLSYHGSYVGFIWNMNEGLKFDKSGRKNSFSRPRIKK